MSKYLFYDWAGRQYDDPAIGLVQPGDVRELPGAPDVHWTLAPEGYDSDGNRGLEALNDETPVTAAELQNELRKGRGN